MDNYIKEGLILLLRDREKRANDVRKEDRNIYQISTLMVEWLQQADEIETYLNKKFPDWNEIPF